MSIRKMEKIIINSHSEFEQYVGKEIGTSDYMKITQEQINLFADATLDHQWIHTDVKRAETESPYKKTISHGYLNLSIVPHLWEQIIEVRNSKLTINYGIEKLRFGQAVLAGDEVRISVRLKSLIKLRNTSKTEVDVKMEIKGVKKSAFDATLIFLYHFE
jgi:acyl dehydratase